MDHPGEQGHTPKVRHASNEKAGLLDAAGHEYVLDSLVLECLDELSQLAYFDPRDAVNPSRKFRHGLTFMGHRDDLHPLFPCSACKGNGEIAVTCNQTDFFHDSKQPAHRPLSLSPLPSNPSF